MSQLERDLIRRFRERLHTIIGDGFDLYEIADLDMQDAGIAIGHELLRAFVRVCLAINDDIAPQKQIIEAIATSLAAMFEQEKQRNERTKT